MNGTRWGFPLAILLAGCSASQAHPAYAVVAAYGDDSHDSVEVVLECERAECERIASSLNRVDGGGYWVEVAP